MSPRNAGVTGNPSRPSASSTGVAPGPSIPPLNTGTTRTSASTEVASAETAVTVSIAVARLHEDHSMMRFETGLPSSIS
jgi:hypothetical protein